MEPSSKKRTKGSVALIILAVLGALFALSATVVYVTSESALQKTWDVQPVDLAIQPTPELVAYGKTIATFRGCRDCHGDNLEGRVVANDMPVMKLAAPNITPGGVAKDYSAKDWARVIRHGVRPDGKPARFMPSYEYTALSHKDMAALIAYAQSVPAVQQVAEPFELGPIGRVLYLTGELPLIAAEMIDHTVKPAAPTPGPTAEYGAYLASSCTGCHGAGFSGGKIPGVPPDWPEARNLTHHESGLAKWSYQDFEKALRTGVTPDGRTLKAPYMPWQNLGQSSDDDLKALWAYTKSLEPRPTGNR